MSKKLPKACIQCEKLFYPELRGMEYCEPCIDILLKASNDKRNVAQFIKQAKLVAKAMKEFDLAALHGKQEGNDKH